MHDTLIEYLDHLADSHPDAVWLRERRGDEHSVWSWRQVQEQVRAVARWQEQQLNGPGLNIGLLSKNRPHWFMADLATIAAGNVTVPLFTTLPQDTARYVIEFTDLKALFVGETDNWDAIAAVLPDDIQLIALPGVELPQAHWRWNDLTESCAGQAPRYRGQRSDLISIVFTSGTTGLPKGVMQTHDCTLTPILRFKDIFAVPKHGRYFSYLPLSHIAERQIVEWGSLVYSGEVYFNENLATLLRDLGDCRPHLLFGPPRVWEQLQQFVIAHFGGQPAIEAALAQDRAGTGRQVSTLLGLDRAGYLLTAAAPTPPALIHWYAALGMELMEGFGQTEAMGLCANTRQQCKVGSIGKAIGEVEARLSADGELLIRADGLATGYYKMPEQTAATFRDGWIHTGDKARIDGDGFIFLTGRVKDYFKTVQGKFVAPTPLENAFAENPHTEQICLLGRGYSKTVMVCVLSASAQQADRAEVEAALLARAEAVNEAVDKHARIGAIIVSTESWTIANSLLTPTLKIRREQIESRFGEQARQLAQQGAEQGRVLCHWHRAD